MDKLAYETLHEIVLPIYPKAPEFTYRETHEAIEQAYRRLLKETEPENIVIMGDASGGNMALSFAQKLMEQEELPLPGKLYLISPWLDISLSNPEITEQVQKKIRSTIFSVYNRLLKCGPMIWNVKTRVFHRCMDL